MVWYVVEQVDEGEFTENAQKMLDIFAPMLGGYGALCYRDEEMIWAHGMRVVPE